MTGWIVLGSILLVLFLLSLLRLGVELVYQEAGLRVWIRVGQIRVSLYPRKRKRQRKQKQKPTKEKRTSQKPKAAKATPEKGERIPSPSPQREKKTQSKAEASPSAQKTAQAKQPVKPKKQHSASERDEGEKKGGLPLPLLDLISLALNAAGTLISRLQIDLLEIRYTIGGKEDPAWAAIQYGLICAGEGGLVPILENSFYCIKRREIQAQVDFESQTSLIWLKTSLSIRVGQLLVFAFQVGWAVFQVYRNVQTNLEETHQEGDVNGTEASN